LPPARSSATALRADPPAGEGGEATPGDELARLRARVQELEDAAGREDQIDVLLSMLSHELRSPVQSLILNVELCLQRQRSAAEDAPEQRWLLEKLLRQRRMAERLKLLIDTFLDVGQIAGGRLRLEPETVDLGELVADLVRRIADDLAWARCPLQLEATPGVIGRWDRLQLDLAISNVLSNALKYGPGAPIVVTVAGTAETAFVRIRDHGPGIAFEDQQRIFDKFSRLRAPSKVGGFGLGLWIVRHILEAAGGSIGVESEPGQGATFTLALPRQGSPMSR
jgi:signal transduction histidine kinase